MLYGLDEGKRHNVWPFVGLTCVFFSDRHTAIVRRFLIGYLLVAGFVQLGYLRIVRYILGSYLALGCLLGSLALRAAVC